MASAVKAGPWGASGGSPRDISRGSKPQRLESIEICSSEAPGGRIYSFSFVYVDQKGEPITVGTWGNSIPGYVKKIEMAPDEHLHSVSGYADRSGVTSLYLKTNQSEYGTYGSPAGSAFSVPLQQGKGEVLAFFGRSGDTLKALGVYVPGKKGSPVKIGPWGGDGSAPRDIPRNTPQKLQSFEVSSTESGGGRIYAFTFTYIDQKGQSIRVGPWGNNGKGETNEFSMNQGEYVNEISGTADDYGVTSLKFKTNQGKYGPFGCSSGPAFSLPLPDNGNGGDNGAAVAFFGRSGDSLVAIGAYVGLATP